MALWQTANEKEMLEECIARCEDEIESMEDRERAKIEKPEPWTQESGAPASRAELEYLLTIQPLGHVKTEMEKTLDGE
jgi:hypothetical protein